VAERLNAPVSKTAEANQQSPVNSSGYENDAENLACFLARLGENWSDLARIVKAWPSLPDVLRNAIAAIVSNSSNRK